MRRAPFLVLALLIAAGMAKAQVNFNYTSYTVDQPTINSTTSGDFNRDGKPDFAVTNGDSVTVFLATTPGHFPATGVTYAVHSSPQGIRTADLNNDGKLDLLVSFYNRAALSVLLGNGDGTFSPAADVPTTLPVGDYALGDFNHDGNIDIAVIECDSSSICDVRAELNKGNATFTPGYKIQMTGYAFNLAARDLDGDGNLDLIVTRQNEFTSDVLIFGGDANGRFPEFTKITPPVYCTGVEGRTCTDRLTGLAVGDFNNDGRLDFALLQSHICGSSCDTASLQTYKNNGSGFSFSRVFDKVYGFDAGPLLAADLNGDGNDDLVFMNGVPDPFYLFLPGAGNSTFNGPNSEPPIAAGLAGPLVRDFNLDSRHDVLLSTADNNAVSVGLNTNAYTNCAPPSSANLAAKICTPSTNATVSSPVLIRASGNSPAGVSRLELWVDGVKQYQKWNDQLAKKLTLSPGSHRVVVVAVDLYKGTAKSTITVNVQ